MTFSLDATDAPLADLNTTPLIDVMLVLLVMFILSVPMATHSIPIDLPTDQPITAMPIRLKNVVSLSPAGVITWNGAPTTEANLAATLSALNHLRPEPLVLFQPEPLAPYGASARTIALIKQSGITSFAFSGNEQFAEFGKTSP